MSYSGMVKLDYVLFAPVNRQIWDTVEAYKPIKGNTWDTIDYSFNREKNGAKSRVQTWVENFEGAKLCVVHAGQIFSMGGADLRILYTPEHLYVDQIPTDMNHSSMICQVVSSEGKALITGDAGAGAKTWLMNVYQDDLKSDIYQHPHHGMTQTGDVTLATWTQAKIVLIPCTVEYYKKNANARTETIRNMSHVVASHVMGEGTVTYRLNGTRVN
jgi:beta-lactamase superfamily II metal-dependent hydrolase